MIGAFLIQHGLEVIPGVCSFCADPALSRGRKPAIVCRSAECRAEYQRLYGQFVRGRTPKRAVIEFDREYCWTWRLELECGHTKRVRCARKPHRRATCSECASEIRRAA